MIPYTRESVVALRNAARNGTPPAQILAQFGWDAGRLARVCRTHGIELSGDDLAPLPPVMAPRAPILPQLPERAAQIFRILQPLTDREQWLTAKQIAAHIQLTTTIRNVRHSIDRLGLALVRLKTPYRLDIRNGPGGGYRLVTEGKGKT